MKKAIFVLSLVLILTIASAVSFAEGGINVRIDSENVVFSDEIGMPFIDENSRTQVPFRMTLESFGAEVIWNNETRTAIAKKGDITVEVPIGEKFILKNGEKVEIDTAAVIKGDRTYLPIRSVIEAFASEVQWDADERTVVITTEPIDARSVLLESYAKSYEWKSQNINLIMNMSMPVPNELGVVEEMKMVLDMKMSAFMDPMKVKATANMLIDAGEEVMTQPVMEMYYVVEDDKFTTYMGMYDQFGVITWTQSSMENEMISEMLNSDVKKNMELSEQSIKEVKYLGKYITEDGKSLLKFENTTSFEAYNEFMGGYMDMLSASTKHEDMLAADMLANMKDFTFFIYIDEVTGEISKYKMDLSSLMASMFSGMTEGEALPKEALEMLKSIKMNIVMEMADINAAEDFSIPKEALDAPEINIPSTAEVEAE